jgi:hypothetical protein
LQATAPFRGRRRPLPLPVPQARCRQEPESKYGDCLKRRYMYLVPTIRLRRSLYLATHRPFLSDVKSLHWDVSIKQSHRDQGLCIEDEFVHQMDPLLSPRRILFAPDALVSPPTVALCNCPPGSTLPSALQSTPYLSPHSPASHPIPAAAQLHERTGSY